MFNKKPAPLSHPQPYALGFLTDYGRQDAYAGVLHAVVLSRLSPEARKRTQCFDLTHDIPPQDIRAGAWQLMQALPYLPPHAAIVAVVDPFVGDAEQAVEVLYRPSYEQVFVAPCNGLLSPVSMLYPDVQRFVLTLDQAQAYGWPYASAAQEASAGNTFHGRDIYTPLAAHLLNQWVQGVTPDTVLEAFSIDAGTPLSNSLPSGERGQDLPWPAATKEGESIHGHVLVQDHFGNVITNIPRHWIEPLVPSPLGERARERGGRGFVAALTLTLGDEALALPLVSHYAAGKDHEAFALFGSHGHLELASFGRPFPVSVERDMPVYINEKGW